MSTAGIVKVSAACPIFYGHDYPRWKAMMRKRLLAMDSELWTATEIGCTKLCKMAHADDIQKYNLLDIKGKAVICSCLSRDEFRCIMHLTLNPTFWTEVHHIIRYLEKTLKIFWQTLITQSRY